jgi:hypothetical protein
MGSPEAKVIGMCEPPDMNAGNRTLVLCRAVSMLAAELSQPLCLSGLFLPLPSCLFSRKETNVAH